LLHQFGHIFDESLFRKTFDRWKSDQDSRISETKFIEFCKTTFNNGLSHEVVLKLMTDTAQFRREIDVRERLDLDSKFVVCVNNHYSYDTHGTTFTNALKILSEEGCIDVRHFQHAIVMPLADQNLDNIVRNERPAPHDVRVFAKQLAEAIAHVHSKGITHGDLKLQHVVRFGDRLRLIDFGAAVEFGSYVGSKFSSGVLPPEMIAKLSMIECGCFKNYFKDVRRTDPVGWVKIDPKKSGQQHFML
jgi:serine/threonine protein kinase